MSFTSDWVAAARAAEISASVSYCDCGAAKTVGYSDLGIPLVACPVCQPSLVANGRKSVGAAWGYQERS
jgi:hypothetical protein